MTYITKDIRQLNEYCMTRNKSIVTSSGQLKGFSNNPFMYDGETIR
jgi:hypothetical protein